MSDPSSGAPSGSAAGVAAVLPADDPAAMARAAAALLAGQLVAFPTETVYGLGANALDPAAVLAIFRCKGRPLTDPVLCHVPDAAAAMRLFALPEEEGPAVADGSRPTVGTVLAALADKFWPGPLTLLAPAHSQVPECVTAGSGYVGARCPSHPVALDLLRRCGVPVAAPSANRFGHISPTSAAHVVGDLGQWPSGLLVLDGGETCDKGIESTIVRVVRPGGGSNAIVVEVVRQGALSVRELMAADLGAEVEFRIIRRETAMDAGVAETAPGQLITHYAPDVESFVLVPGCSGSGSGGGGEIIPEVQLASCVIVDFGGAQAALRSRAAAYEDISARGDPVEAAANLFAALRRAEIVEGARAVLLPDLRDDDRGSEAAVFDRIYRAASGKFACLDTEGLVRAAVDPRGGKV